MLLVLGRAETTVNTKKMCTSGTGSTNRTLRDKLVTAVMLTEVQQRLFSGIQTLTKSNTWKLKPGFIFHLNLLMKTKNQSSEPLTWVRNAVSWDSGANTDPHASCNPVWARSTVSPVLDRRVIGIQSSFQVWKEAVFYNFYRHAPVRCPDQLQTFCPREKLAATVPCLGLCDGSKEWAPGIRHLTEPQHQTTMIHDCNSVRNWEHADQSFAQGHPEQLTKSRPYLCPDPHSLQLAELFQKAFSSELLCATLMPGTPLAQPADRAVLLCSNSALTQSCGISNDTHCTCQPAHQFSTICQRTAG